MTQGLIQGTRCSREGLFSAQTPQGFHFETILRAHREAAKKELNNFTDDSALAEWANIPVQLVEGEANNIKITTLVDMNEAININEPQYSRCSSWSRL